MSTFEYHIKVKPIVDDIVVLDNDYNVIGMMDPAEDYEDDEDYAYKIFNTQLPVDTKQIIIIALNYGVGGGTTEYEVNDLLSIPITENNIEYTSPIIVNTHHEITCVLVTVPKVLSKFNMKRFYLLSPFAVDSAAKLEEYLIKGIDPKAKNWIAKVDLNIPKLDHESMKKYLHNRVTIHCYRNYLQTHINIFFYAVTNSINIIYKFKN